MLMFLLVFACVVDKSLSNETTISSVDSNSESVSGDAVSFVSKCDQIKEQYYRQWYLPVNQQQLTRYLSDLKRENCSEYVTECVIKTFNFNDFTSLVYDHFCNFTRFKNRCKDALNEVVNARSNSTREWTEVLDLFRHTRLTYSAIQMPCVQVALYNKSVQKHSSIDDHYYELRRVAVPFCGFIWCGVDRETAKDHDISLWTCMSSLCRANVIIIYVVCGILSFLIIVTNLSVLTVSVLNKKLRNSQGIYKMSLALSDLLVGLVVLPTFPVSLSKQLNEGKLSVVGPSQSWQANITDSTTQVAGSAFPAAQTGFDEPYIRAIGFVTTLSFTASVYTLLMASFDRLSVVRRHLKYCRDAAKLYAIRGTVILWLVSVFFSTLPFYIQSLNYGLIASVFIASTGSSSLYVYIVTFALPLAMLWGTSITTLYLARKHGKATRNIIAHRSSQKDAKNENTEMRLARTLGIMVAVFTLSLLPIVISLLLPFFLSDIYITRPDRLSQFSFSAANSFEFVAVIILVCNSLWNFFIYNGRNADFTAANTAMYQRLWVKLGLKRAGNICFLCCTKENRNDPRKARFSVSESRFWTSITTLTLTRRKKSNDINCGVNQSV